MKSPHLILLIGCILLTVAAFSPFVEAAQRVIPTLAGQPPPTTVPQYILYIYWGSLAVGGVLAFGLIVWGGLLYITSAGNPSQQSNARAWIGSAVLGLLLLLGAYIILNTINPELVALKFPTLTPPPRPTPAVSTTPPPPGQQWYCPVLPALTFSTREECQRSCTVPCQLKPAP